MSRWERREGLVNYECRHLWDDGGANFIIDIISTTCFHWFCGWSVNSFYRLPMHKAPTSSLLSVFRGIHGMIPFQCLCNTRHVSMLWRILMIQYPVHFFTVESRGPILKSSYCNLFQGLIAVKVICERSDDSLCSVPCTSRRCFDFTGINDDRDKCPNNRHCFPTF